MTCTLSSRNVPTPWLSCTIPLPRCHFPLSPVFRFSVVLSGQPCSKVKTFIKNSKGKGTVPGGKRQEMLVIHVLVENTVVMLDKGGGRKTFDILRLLTHYLESCVVLVTGGWCGCRTIFCTVRTHLTLRNTPKPLHTGNWMREGGKILHTFFLETAPQWSQIHKSDRYSPGKKI